MRKRVRQSMSLVIGIGLLSTTPALADPVTVTSGLVTAQITGGSFTLRGDGFSLSGAAPAGYASGLWQCNPCRASERLNLSLSSSADGSFDDLPGTFDHVQYDATFLTGHLAFTAGDMTSAILAADRTSISMPFTFFGELANYDSFRSRATPGSVPLFVATFTGSGIATAHFRGPVADPNGALFFADRITYDFAAAAPSATPEPASLLLLATGAAGLVARRRRTVQPRTESPQD